MTFLEAEAEVFTVRYESVMSEVLSSLDLGSGMCRSFGTIMLREFLN